VGADRFVGHGVQTSHGVGHLSPSVLPEAGRALDIDEQECDGTGWYAEPSSDAAGHHLVVPGQGAKQAAGTVSSLVHEPSLRPDRPRNLVRVSYVRVVGVVQTIDARAVTWAQNVSAFAYAPCSPTRFATLSWAPLRPFADGLGLAGHDEPPQLLELLPCTWKQSRPRFRQISQYRLIQNIVGLWPPIRTEPTT
jgi:hypothetical protein